MMREPKTASASPSRRGATISRKVLRRVLAVAVEHDHDVQSVLDGEVVAGLLVAAVAEVGRLPDQGDRQVGDLLVAEADQVGRVLAVVVADDHLFDVWVGSRRESGREPWPGWSLRCRRRRGCRSSSSQLPTYSGSPLGPALPVIRRPPYPDGRQPVPKVGAVRVYAADLVSKVAFDFDFDENSPIVCRFLPFVASEPIHWRAGLVARPRSPGWRRFAVSLRWSVTGFVERQGARSTAAPHREVLRQAHRHGGHGATGRPNHPRCAGKGEVGQPPFGATTLTVAAFVLFAPLALFVRHLAASGPSPGGPAPPRRP